MMKLNWWITYTKTLQTLNNEIRCTLLLPFSLLLTHLIYLSNASFIKIEVFFNIAVFFSSVTLMKIVQWFLNRQAQLSIPALLSFFIPFSLILFRLYMILYRINNFLLCVFSLSGSFLNHSLEFLNRFRRFRHNESILLLKSKYNLWTKIKEHQI